MVEPGTTTRAQEAFSSYADELLELLAGHVEAPEAADRALDGGTAAVLRRRIPLATRRESGAFLTGRQLAEHLVEGAPAGYSKIVDPTCGAGDLLLAAAKRLPREKSAIRTLETWGLRLVGRDLDEVLVRTARIRLALLAAQLTETRLAVSESRIERALPDLRHGDGRALSFEMPILMLLNPPFGATVDARPWGSGRLARAAVFADDCFRLAPAGSSIRAILPDVLRSGSNLRRWREAISELLSDACAEEWGQFDRWTDVDVFLLKGKRGTGGTQIEWWPTGAAGSTIADSFSVRVGVVVPHRDPERGPVSPYICARDLPVSGEHRAGKGTRRHTGTRFPPPFVAIRRTSRPADGQRLTPTLVRGTQPVLVENHLIVCVPHDGTIARCKELIGTLNSAATTDILNRRIRCRHLTVSSIREIPFSPPAK